jgi:MFS family permease
VLLRAALALLVSGWGASVLSIPLLIGAALLLDGAVQANQVLGQRIVQSIDPEARGRLNAAYMTVLFLCGATGSALGSLTCYHGGWWMTAGIGCALALAVFGFFLTELRERPGADAAPHKPSNSERFSSKETIMALDLIAARVLVIGATRGIGAATANAFEAAGAHVERPSRDTLDILHEAGVAAYFAAQGPFDYVVIAAATTKGGPVRELALEDAQAAMDSKFFGAYRVTRHTKLDEHGSLTFVSDFLSRGPNVSSVLQGAINSALDALARGLALELSPIRVIVYRPG